MTSKKSGGGKLPGKTIFSGRRRATTRTSGFKVHADTTGGEFRRSSETKFALKAGETITITFTISGHQKGDLIGYGAWYWASEGVVCSVKGGADKKTLTEFQAPSWNKVGSMWQATDNSSVKVVLTLAAKQAATAAIFDPKCGVIRNGHLKKTRPQLMLNMFQFAPEALFISDKDAGKVDVHLPGGKSTTTQDLVLKSCNRCGRFLPINTSAERDSLSFSNHCVAPHRRPCKHATFGRLRNMDDENETLKLEYGFQLECRFCKKFEVNAAHNPQRSGAQMKEDGARRRAFELLLADLYQGTPQLRYRHETGKELANVIWERFNRRCFNCDAPLPKVGDMHLDHTRPLALLWPLDDTATALCGPCNSEKRDRMPNDFYDPKKLAKLSEVTGIPMAELTNPTPNEAALALLLNRTDWFFDEFLVRDEMTKERDGKVAGELVVKALQKVISNSPRHKVSDLQGEYEIRRDRGKKRT